jgi:type IV pilus assembly protein PilM
MVIIDKKKLINIFPAPDFLKMQPAGLDISDRRIRFLEFKKDKNGIVIDKFDSVDIPEGVVISGEIKKPEELKKILKELKDKNNIEFVNVSLPEEKAYIEKMDVPNVLGDELRNSIMFQLEEYIPIPASDAVLDYTVLNNLNTTKKTKEVMVYVLSKKVASTYTDMFSDTGILPISFEIEAHSLARAVVPKENTDAVMVVDFGRTRSGISIIKNGILLFASTAEIGSDMLTRAIEKNFSISTKEAFEMKNKKGLTKNKKDEEFFLAVLPTISILHDEINKLFVYWHTHNTSNIGEDKKIKQIILCGGGSNLKGLTEYLSVSLKIDVVTSDPWVNVNSYDKYIPELKSNEALGYSTAIGLALKTFES